VLLSCAVFSLLLANSPVGKYVTSFWETPIGFEVGVVHLRHTLVEWINDGLMAIFFLLIGLEIERELYVGELSDHKNALLPVFAALGGMIVPAGLYFLITSGTEAQAGFGIPMATDIAFALGALALLGKRVPVSLKVFLTALAIIDDIGAILVIALFYSGSVSVVYLLLAFAIFGGLLIMNRRGVRALPLYIIPGVLMWYLMSRSGVHASISGILLAFAIPFSNGTASSPSYTLQHFLHKPVAFGIMPLFALANTGVALASSGATVIGRNTLGILAGLLIGKPLGIISFSLGAAKLGWLKIPRALTPTHLVGAGFLAGIGFTMSIFITLLAFGNSDLAHSSKLAVMLASLLAGTIGFVILRRAPTASE
jgi:NhaA family Na+:H+ antiporter